MPDTPTVTPLDCQHSTEPTQYGDEVAQEMRDYYERHKRMRHSPGCADNLMIGLLNIAWSHPPKPALRPVEADDAGLIERVSEIIEDSLLNRWPIPVAGGYAYLEKSELRELLDRLASLSAAKVEAEKEVERLREKLRIKIVPGDKVVLEDDGALSGRAQGDGR